MHPHPFDEEKDYAPTPFDRRHCETAARLKQAGLRWFIRMGLLCLGSPGFLTDFSVLPNRVYFSLSA